MTATAASTMTRGTYSKNDGLRKRCDCKRKRWSECDHDWFFNLSYRGRSYRFNINREASRTFLTKTEAEALRDEYKAAIRNGTFRKTVSGTSPTESDPGITFGELSDHYLQKFVRKPTRSKRSARGMEWYVTAMRALELSPGVPAESLPLTRFGVREIETMRTLWTGRRKGVKGGTVGPNRMLSRLRHMFNWAIERGYLDAHPFKRHGRNVVRLDSDVEGARTRRLVGDEEARLLQHARPHLHALIIAALETGCRLGELLSLQWKHVDLAQHVWVLPAANTKTREARDVPITTRLKAVLDMRRLDPAGQEHSPEAFVFGNDVGERAKSIRQAWRNTCRRAKITGLTFHDLRREFASRLLESGAPAHEVRDWLGHSNITTTSRYLATTRVALQKARQRFEQHRPLPNAQPASEPATGTRPN